MVGTREKRESELTGRERRKRGLVLGGGGEEGMVRALSGGWSFFLPGVVGVLRGSAIMGLIYVSFDKRLKKIQ